MPTQAELLKKHLDSLNKEYGAGTIGFGNYAEIQRVRTGLLSVDIETGGGIPRSRIVQIYGEYSSGKTLLAKVIAARYQRTCIDGTSIKLDEQGEPVLSKTGEYLPSDPKSPIPIPMTVVVLDLEGTDDASWDRRIGLDTGRVVRAQLDDATKASDLMGDLLRSHEVGPYPPGLIIVDSIGGMIPRDVVEKPSDKEFYSKRAKIVQRMIEKVVSGLQTKPHGAWHYTTVLLLNQTRTNITRFGGFQKPMGGQALGFFNAISMRLRVHSYWDAQEKEVSGKESDDEEDLLSQVAGQTTVFFTDKNKTAPPRRSGLFSFHVNGPRAGQVNDDPVVLTYALRYGVITKSGSWYTFGKHRAQGSAGMLAHLRENNLLPGLREQVFTTALDHVRNFEGRNITAYVKPTEDEEPEFSEVLDAEEEA